MVELFVSDASPKRIDREGLGESSTGTWQMKVASSQFYFCKFFPNRLYFAKRLSNNRVSVELWGTRPSDTKRVLVLKVMFLHKMQTSKKLLTSVFTVT